MLLPPIAAPAADVTLFTAAAAAALSCARFAALADAAALSLPSTLDASAAQASAQAARRSAARPRRIATHDHDLASLPRRRPLHFSAYNGSGQAACFLGHASLLQAALCCLFCCFS
jgi:hypothetical protein